MERRVRSPRVEGRRVTYPRTQVQSPHQVSMHMAKGTRQTGTEKISTNIMMGMEDIDIQDSQMNTQTL
eukprot:5498667-Prorocentrum_lima.AAC.1